MAQQTVTGSRRHPYARAAVLLLTALLLALTGCSGTPDTAADASADASADPAEPAGASAADPAGGSDEPVPEQGGQEAAEVGAGEDDVQPGARFDAGALGVPPGAAGQGRQVVTSSVDVAVGDVPAAARRVRDLALVAGGFVSGESSVGGEQPRAEITLRVPVGAADDVMTDVAALGEEVARTTDSEDVEGRLVDLESRTATQRAGVERVRALLERAESLDDVLALETELTRRQADLESVAAQQAALADRAALATVTVLLTRPDDVQAVTEPLPPFLQGLGSGWEALLASMTVVLVVVGALLPFGVVAVALGAAAWAVLRATRGAGGQSNA